MECKIHRSARRPGTGPLDPSFERAAFFVALETTEISSVVPQARRGTGQLVF